MLKLFLYDINLDIRTINQCQQFVQAVQGSDALIGCFLFLQLGMSGISAHTTKIIIRAICGPYHNILKTKRNAQSKQSCNEHSCYTRPDSRA